MKTSKNYMNLTEATIKALQGTLLNESLNVSLQDDGSTVVDTEEATVIVQERQSAEEIVDTTPVPVEEPVTPEECPECIEVPQDIETTVEEPTEDLDESKELKTETSDRVKQLLDIVDNSFEFLEESKELNEDEKLEEAIKLTSIKGITRDPSNDFSDDGHRFTCYLYKGVVPISYLKSDGNIYLTIAMHHLDDINYEEYKTFPSYKLTSEFNGVSESSFNAEKFTQNLEAAYNDIINFRENVEPVDNEALESRIKEINEACKEVEAKVKDYIKGKEQQILALRSIQFEDLKDHIKSCGSRTADYIREASDSSKRDFMSKDIEYLKKQISNSWRFEYIEELIGDKKTEESKKITESISYSDSIISALEDGLLEWETVCRECLTCMSEDDIADMIRICDWESVISTGDNEEEFNESKKVAESLKYNKESFSKAVETYLKNKNKKIESFKATKVLTKEGKIRIKGIMTEANNKRTLISLEMNQIRKGKTYEKYELINSNGILLENKNNTCTSVLIDIKDKVLECRNLITKNK